ncbi:hypothetical protein [Nocardioides psychrotolerans]|uniref:hypothetical protein n=1 Tax=Nocardioides psychrotolerans TaxID=1005945 RepID=UPI003137D872
MTPARQHSATGRHVVGAFFLVMGGVHLGIVAADPQFYDGFATGGLFPFVREGWDHVVMARPAVYGLLLMAGEVTLGTALLLGGRTARFGWAGVILFHVLLMLFGWGVWLWSVPALAILVPLAAHDLRPVSPEAALQGAA